MKVLIDGTPLLLRSAGVKNYLYHWALALTSEAPEAVRVFPFLNQRLMLRHDRSVIDRSGTAARMLLVNLLNIRGNPMIDLVRYGCDIFHMSQNLVNPPGHTHVTATVYDMSCWLLPEVHTAANIAATRMYADRVLRRCDAVIAISEHTRSDAIELLGLQPERVSVVYPGIADEFYHPCPESMSRVRRLYGLEKPYILNVGTIEPRKNVSRLIGAYKALPEGLRGEVDLVIAGFLGWKSEQEETLLACTRGVRYLGYVPESDLVGLTAGAVMLAYPSLYEGFGFPVAQAMAAGVPVVTSRNSSLAEISGDAANLVDSYDEDDISAGMLALLNDSSLASMLSARGKERAALYTWERAARDSFRFFRQVMDRSRI